MRKHRASNTAKMVAYQRALGNLIPAVPGFVDPVAEEFLPEKWKKRVEKVRDRIPASPFPFWFRGMGIFNQFRTVVLDKAIGSALPFQQLVILGAGLDGRAWRLPGLENTVVFEVDHPATQLLKRQQATLQSLKAKDIRFVGIDFTVDHIVAKLDESGFNRDAKTFWLWEGGTMYLKPKEVAATFSSIAELSGRHSSVAFTYMGKKAGKVPGSLFLRLIGEPIRSGFSRDELVRLALDSGWDLTEDSGIKDWIRGLSPGMDLTERKVGMQWYERIAVAVKC